MKPRYVLLSFVLMGWGYYELSGGADFVPETRVAGGAEAGAAPATPVTRANVASATAPVLPSPQPGDMADSATPPVPAQEEPEVVLAAQGIAPGGSVDAGEGVAQPAVRAVPVSPRPRARQVDAASTAEAPAIAPPADAGPGLAATGTGPLLAVVPPVADPPTPREAVSVAMTEAAPLPAIAPRPRPARLPGAATAVSLPQAEARAADVALASRDLPQMPEADAAAVAAQPAPATPEPAPEVPAAVTRAPLPQVVTDPPQVATAATARATSGTGGAPAPSAGETVAAASSQPLVVRPGTTRLFTAASPSLAERQRAGDAPQAAPEEEASDLRLVTEAAVSLHDGPGLGHAVLDDVARGTRAQVVATANGWAQVVLPDTGRTGWIAERLLRKPAL